MKMLVEDLVKWPILTSELANLVGTIRLAVPYMGCRVGAQGIPL